MAAGPRHWHTKRGKITGGDEGSFAVNARLQLLAYVLDDMVPGTGGLVLVVAGQAGHVASSYRGVPDAPGRAAGGASPAALPQPPPHSPSPRSRPDPVPG